MIKKYSTLLVVILLISSCGPAVNEDDQLTQAVQAAIASASDLPPSGLLVVTENGVVKVSGAIECEDCGGLRTPGGVDNIQLSLGAVIRAVPGVERVEFSLE